ncbi:response regulator [Qipengyuania sp.]|uniref:response regulator n=1 Tax=Qipengyuania sp. TaxID=2004515 RepID=UPI0035C7A7A3
MKSPVILVAEDEAIIAYDLCETIESAGFTVAGPFDDPSSALLSAQTEKPDIAILDIKLFGGTTAYALAEKLIAEDIPVIFHSGQVTVEEVRERFPQAWALSKPCPPGEILERVSEALRPQ